QLLEEIAAQPVLARAQRLSALERDEPKQRARQRSDDGVHRARACRPAVPATTVLVDIEAIDDVLAERAHEVSRDAAARRRSEPQRIWARLNIRHRPQFAAPALGSCGTNLAFHSGSPLSRARRPAAAS